MVSRALASPILFTLFVAKSSPCWHNALLGEKSVSQYCSNKNTSSLGIGKKGEKRRQRGCPDGILKPSSKS
jgi:hypothetical protein